MGRRKRSTLVGIGLVLLAAGVSSAVLLARREGGSRVADPTDLIATGTVRDLDAFLRAGHQINGRYGNSGQTLLAIAAAAATSDRKRGVVFVDFLLERGADPNTTDALGLPPLLGAALAGSTEVVDALLAHGARVDARDPHGRTALHLVAMCAAPAVQAGDPVGTARTLVAHGADVRARDQAGQTAFDKALARSSRGTDAQRRCASAVAGYLQVAGGGRAH